MLRNGLTGVFAVAVALVVGQLVVPTPAFATFACGSFSGTDVDFNTVQETSTTDPEPLFCSGVVLATGNTLTLFPTNFSASATGAFGFDETSSQLQSVIMSTSALTIDQVLITEFGDTDLSGISPGGGTGTIASMSGQITVLETTGAVPCVGPACIVGFNATFSPSDILALPGDPGTTNWSASVLVDIAGSVPGATKVELSLDNILQAFSEIGTTAIIQKKVGGPISITVIPEPTTLALLGGGVLAMGCLARFRRG
jgi:hypothetical protein